MIKGSLRGETYVPVSEAFEIVRSLPHGHVAAVVGMARKLNVGRLVASRPSRQRDLVLAMVVGRIIDPGAKLATCRGLRAEGRPAHRALRRGRERGVP